MIMDKLIIIPVILLVIISLSAALDFQEWCQQYGKVYKTVNEQKKREQIFNDNIRIVKELNEEYKGKDVTFAINAFADMTTEEFQSKILMPNIPKLNLPETRVGFKYRSINAPDTFDWRAKNVVTDVKNQGDVGSCWAFSTVGNIEGQWAMAGNNLTSLSVQQLVDCDGTYYSYDVADCGVHGGFPILAYEYIMQAGGIESEESYPYCSGDHSCSPCAPSSWNNTTCSQYIPKECNMQDSCSHKLDRRNFIPGLKLKKQIWLDPDEQTIQRGILEYGPLSACFDATKQIMHYKSGVIDPSDCTTTTNHAILIVGYGEDNGQPYWLIKNSWGTDWGMDGYMKLLRGNNTCGISEFVTTAILE